MVNPLCSWLVQWFNTDIKILEIDRMSIPIKATLFEEVMEIKDGSQLIETCGWLSDIIEMKVLFNSDVRGVPCSRIENLVLEDKDGA